MTAAVRLMVVIFLIARPHVNDVRSAQSMYNIIIIVLFAVAAMAMQNDRKNRVGSYTHETIFQFVFNLSKT